MIGLVCDGLCFLCSHSVLTLRSVYMDETRSGWFCIAIKIWARLRLTNGGGTISLIFSVYPHGMTASNMSQYDFDFDSETAKLVRLRDKLVEECEQWVDKRGDGGDVSELPRHISRFTERYERLRLERQLTQRSKQNKEFKADLQSRRFDLIKPEFNEEFRKFVEYERAVTSVTDDYASIGYPEVTPVAMEVVAERPVVPCPVTQTPLTHMPRGPLRSYENK